MSHDDAGGPAILPPIQVEVLKKPRRCKVTELAQLITKLPDGGMNIDISQAGAELADVVVNPPPCTEQQFGEAINIIRLEVIKRGMFIVATRLEKSILYTAGGQSRMQAIFTVRPCENNYEGSVVMAELFQAMAAARLWEEAQGKQAEKKPGIIMTPNGGGGAGQPH